MNSTDTKAEQLFRSMTVGQIKEINDSLLVQATEKTKQLRTLVADKYRSLLSTADNIIAMNEISQEQDTQLSYLCDLNDGQETSSRKLTVNYRKFNNFVKGDKVDWAVTMRVVILMLQLSVEAVQVAGSGVIDIAKEMLVVEQALLESRVSRELGQRFSGVRQEYLRYLRGLIVRSSLGSEDYLSFKRFSEVVAALVIVQQSSLAAVLNQVLELRETVVKKLHRHKKLLEFKNLQTAMNYMFLTLSYASLFLSNSLSLVSILGRSLAFGPGFEAQFRGKYYLVLDRFEQLAGVLRGCSFVHNEQQILEEVSHGKLQHIVASFKESICQDFVENFSLAVKEIGPQVSWESLVGLLDIVIGGFKRFHNLGILTVDKEDVLERVVGVWKSKVGDILGSQIRLLAALVGVLDQNFASPDKADGLWNLSGNDKKLDNVNEYLVKISSLASTGLELGSASFGFKAAVLKLVEYFVGLRHVIVVFKQHNLESFVSKEVDYLSLEDDDEYDVYAESGEVFCQSYKAFLKSVLEEIWSEYFNKELAKSLNEFLQLLGELKSHRPTPDYDFFCGILRVLIIFEQSISSKSFQGLLDTDVAETQASIERLLDENFSALVDILDLHTEFDQLLTGRFSKNVCPLEVEIWENGLPLSCSVGVSFLLSRVCKRLIGGENLDLFKHKRFAKYRGEIFEQLFVLFETVLKRIAGKENSIKGEGNAINGESVEKEGDSAEQEVESDAIEGKENDNTEKEKEDKQKIQAKDDNGAEKNEFLPQQLLLSYADLLFLQQFHECKNATAIKELLNQLSGKILLSGVDEKYIRQNVADQFILTKLICLPLS